MLTNYLFNLIIWEKKWTLRNTVGTYLIYTLTICQAPSYTHAFLMFFPPLNVPLGCGLPKVY